MNLSELYEQYAAGELEKHKYIELMRQKHQALFEYSDYLKGTDIESITIGNGDLYVTVKGSRIKLLLDRDDSRFIPIEMLNFRSIDPRERAMLARIMPAKAVVFDVGANIGWYTLNFAKMPRVRKVYAFEPVPYTYKYLLRHLKLNEAVKVAAFNIGFSDKTKNITFYWTKKETGSSSMTNLLDRPGINKVKCRITTIDAFMKNRPKKIDLIKCDVEGSELFVFQGGLRTIGQCRPMIYTEMLRKWSKKFGYHPDDIIDLLAGLGYVCYGYVGAALKRIDRVSPELATTNFFFFHRNKHQKIIKGL